MTSHDDSARVPIDAELQRHLRFDTLLFTLTRPVALIGYLALIAAAIFLASALPTISAQGRSNATLLQWLLFAIIALLVASIWFTRASIRRAIETAMPRGSFVRAEVQPHSLIIASKRGVSRARYAEVRSVHARRYSVLIRMHQASAVLTVPRAALSDDDLATLRQRIAETKS